MIRAQHGRQFTRARMGLAIAPALLCYAGIVSGADELNSQASQLNSLYQCVPNASGAAWQCAAASGVTPPKPRVTPKHSAKLGQEQAELTEFYAHDWQPLSKVPLNERDQDCHRCEGRYSEPEYEADPSASGDDIKASADRSETTATGSTLSGNVLLKQGARRIAANKVSIETEQERLDLSGNVTIREPGVLLSSDSATLARGDQSLHLENAQFVFHQQGLHGRAQTLEQTESGAILVSKGALSYCAPTDPSWELRAEELILNRETGVGQARGAQLRVLDTPLIALPAVSFPIDDRRKSGALWPSISDDSTNGLSVSAPIYLNLAPNYDLLYTPSYLQERGFHQTLQGRYLSASIGAWESEMGYLDSDDLGFSGGQPGDRRWHIKAKQDAQYNDHWSSSIELARISDPNYLRDLDSGQSNSRYQDQLIQEGELRYQSEHLDAALSARKLQSTALDLSDGYASAPQFELRYRSQTRVIEPYAQIQWTQFEHNDKSLAQGERLYANAGVQANWRAASGYAKVRATWQELRYSLDTNPLIADLKPSTAGERQWIDLGLHFDRIEKDSRTTLTPRLFYVHATRDEDIDVPLFDTKVRTIRAGNWFNDSLINGHDRLTEEHRAIAALHVNHVSKTLEVETRLAYMSFLDEPQDPLLRSTLAYQTDELIGLDAKIAFSQALSANLDVVSDANSGDLLSQFIELQWRGAGNDIFSVGYSSNDSFIRREQIHVSGTYRLTSDWRMLFAANVDTRHNADLETLFGIEYESCCWRVRIIHSQYQDVPDGSYFLTKDDWREEQQTQIEVVLKGLGGFGQAIDSTLNQMIRGFHESIR